jgi:broad specificity phosphatase PhoE
MKFLEVRRHSKRNASQPHLSQEGVSLARCVGNTMGHFDRVVTSTLPRAFDTAIAMGYAVDYELEELMPADGLVSTEVDLDASYAEVARAVKLGRHAANYAKEMAKLWRELITLAGDGGSVLVITHGGVIEMGVVACLPHADPAPWGRAASYCEGARLAFENDAFVDVEILRLTISE